MTPQEVVAENLLLHQLDFLQRSLGRRYQLGCRVDEPAPARPVRHVSVHATARPRARSRHRAAAAGDGRRPAHSRRRARRDPQHQRGLGVGDRHVLVRSVPRAGDGQGARAPSPTDTVEELLDDIDERIASTVLRQALFSRRPRRGRRRSRHRPPRRVTARPGRRPLRLTATPTGARPTANAVEAGEVGVDLARRRNPPSAAARRRASPCRQPISSTSHPPAPATAARRRRSSRRASRPSAPANNASVRLPLAHRSARPPDRHRRCTAGSPPPRATRRAARSGSASNHEPSAKRTFADRRPDPAALARATSSASADTSVSHTVVPSSGSSPASDNPIAPLPVPRSAHAHRAPRAAQPARGQLDQLLGLGPGDQHPAIDHQIEVPERPVPEHVLQWLAGAAAGHHRIEVAHRPLGRRLVEHVEELVAVDTAGLLTQPAGLRPARPAGARSRPTAAASVIVPSPCHRTRQSVAGASWRARSSAMSASTTSSRSPASTSASR